MSNRHNRATRTIVASGSLFAIIMLVIPWVDEYIGLRKDAEHFSELEVEMTANQQREAQLRRIEPKLVAELESLQSNSTTPEQVNDFRESVIGIVRKAGGRLRRLEISELGTRPWAMANDHPGLETMPIYEPESDYVLHKHTVELQADGTLEAVRQIIQDVCGQGWLMTTTGLSATPTGVRESPVTLELRLVLFGLAPKPPSAEDDEDYFEEEELAALVTTIR